MGLFVCAFRGRRDSYQAAVALAEGGLLDQFITDGYALPWVKSLAKIAPLSVRSKVDARSDPGIPAERVRCLWGTTAIEHLRHRLGIPRMLTFNKLDRRFSRAAARRAAKTRSDLFLYSSYAWEAFTAHYPHIPRRVLFQYHPHPELERRILAQDSAQYPRVGDSYLGTKFGQVPDDLAERDRDAWKHADLILCASTFTKRSLLEVGVDDRCCCVVPYGIEIPELRDTAPATDSFHVVFVGSGGQRKGLHHLLLAWQTAVLPASSKLTLVCRVMDAEIGRVAAETPRVQVLDGVPQYRLNSIYAGSSLFVMPSLVEGFGQVYLEALAQGCPVLGTAHSCLPDLGGESDGVFLVQPACVDELVSRLEELSRILPGNSDLRHSARACAAKFTWSRFRNGLRQTLTQ